MNARLGNLSVEQRRQFGRGTLYATLIAFTFFIWPVTGYLAQEAELELSFNLPRVLFLCVAAFLSVFSLRRDIIARTTWLYLIAGYAGFVLLTALLAPDPDGWTYLLLGAPTRSDGLLYQAGLAGFAMAIGSQAHRSAVFRRDLIRVVFLAGAAQAALMILQALRLDIVGPILYGTLRFANPVGTITNTGMAAGMLLPLVVLALFRVHQRATGGRTRAAWSYLALALLLTVALGATQNRSALIATGAALLAAVPFVRSWRFSGLVVGFAAVALVAPTLFPAAYQPVHEPEQSLLTRTQLWSVGVETIRETRFQPFAGAGADGVRLAQLRGDVAPEALVPFLAIRYGWGDRFGYPEATTLVGIERRSSPTGPLRGTNYLFEFETADGERFFINQGVIVDRAHNLILDKAASYGIGAGLVWLLLFVVPIWVALRRRTLEHLAFGAALGALLLYSMAWFAVVSTEIYHVALLAAAWGVAFGAEAADERNGSAVDATPAIDTGGPRAKPV